METERHSEETLRLQFGTAANTIGAQLYAIEKLSDGNPGLHRSDGKPRMLAFEAKGRIHRKTSSTTAVNRETAQPEPNSWGGGVQVYDQASSPPATSLPSSAYWNWDDFSDKNLVEIDEFRPHMPLHNLFEGHAASRDGRLTVATADAIEDRLRSVLEECDNLRFVQNFVDMDSSWAGVSLDVLTYLSEECPSAVVATFGNDWNYPLSDQSDVDLYSAGIESRDKTKIRARRRINLAASVASFVEISSVFVPVALSSSSRRYTLGSSSPAPELLSAASFAATAIEIALSAFRATAESTIYGLLEGLVPSMKILELAARFPLIENPVALVDDATALSDTEQQKWTQHSLLPQWERTQARGFGSRNATAISAPPRFRRVHFRGEFETHASMLQSAMQRFQPANCVVQWTPDQVYLEQSASSTIVALDGASQLALSSGVGQFLGCLTAPMSRSDKRIVYEFTQAGMNVDALEDIQAVLRAYSDAYPRADVAQRDPWDDEEEDDEEMQ